MSATIPFNKSRLRKLSNNNGTVGLPSLPGNPALNARVYEGAEEEEPLDCVVAPSGGRDYDAYDGDAMEPQSGEGAEAQEESGSREPSKDLTPPANEEATGDSVIEYDSKRKCWHTSIDFPQELYGRLIGTGRRILKKMEQETGCKIKVPERGRQGPVEITTHVAADNASRCRDQIEMILISVRQKLPFTHFVTFQIRDQAFVQRYKDLVDKIRALRNIPDVCLNEKLYIIPEKIHLTIAPLWLLTEEDERRARACLDNVVAEKIKPLLNGQAPKAKIQTLGHFGGEEISAVRVLYGKVYSDKLQEISDSIAKAFEKIGLSGKRKTDNVKLHLTILNTRYLVEQSSSERAPQIDATEIVKHFGDYDFGEVEIDKVLICKMHDTDPDTKGHPTIYSKEL